MANTVTVYIRVSEAVAQTLDNIVEARRSSLQPTNRAALARTAVVAYCEEHGAVAPTRTRTRTGGAHAP